MQVGRVEQVETAAQAKARRGPKAKILRQLTRIHTPATATGTVFQQPLVQYLISGYLTSGHSCGKDNGARHCIGRRWYFQDGTDWCEGNLQGTNRVMLSRQQCMCKLSCVLTGNEKCSTAPHKKNAIKRIRHLVPLHHQFCGFPSDCNKSQHSASIASC